MSSRPACLSYVNSPEAWDGIGLTRDLFRFEYVEVKNGIPLRELRAASFSTYLGWCYLLARASRDAAARAGTGGAMP